VLVWLLLAFEGGCGNVPLAGRRPDDDRPTLPSTVVADESQDADGLVAPGEAETPTAELSILARPVFCCNPLAVDFEALAEDVSWLEGASLLWNFGDGRTRSGPTPTHAYASPGVYIVSLAVEGADGRYVEARAILELALDEDGEASLVAWEDGADSGPATLEEDAAFTDELTVQPAEENSAPIAEDRIVTTGAGTAVVFQLIATDADGDDLTFTVVTAPEHGTLGPVSGVMTGFATVVYEPDAEFAGIDTLVYEADDGITSSNPATVTIEVEAGPGRPEVGDRVRAAFVGEPVTLTLHGTDPDGDTLLFTIVSGPASGDLGPIQHVAPDRAEVTYFPEVGFEGEDSFSFVASNGRVDSAPATFTVVVTKRFVPWVEIHVGSAEGVDIVLTGLLEWRKITDTAIVSVEPGQTSFFGELKGPLPDMRIIPGIKTSPLFGRRQFDSVEKWREMAEEVRAACEASGQQRFLFENESALTEYYHGECELDLDLLRVGLNELPTDIQYLWCPSLGGSGERLERGARLCEAVEAVLDVRFVDHLSIAAPQYVGQPGTLTAVERLESIAQNPTIPLIYSCGDKYWPVDRIPEALELARLKWGDAAEAIVYPGQERWVQHAREMVQQQPALDRP
jgi:PKD repeat protein